MGFEHWFGILVQMRCTICTVFFAGQRWASRLRLFATFGYIFAFWGGSTVGFFETGNPPVVNSLLSNPSLDPGTTTLPSPTTTLHNSSPTNINT